MCGIVGYTGRRNAAPVLLSGLKKLEYRGYDSAGVALLNENKIEIFKRKGRVKEIACAASLAGRVGIAHTRWATHGVPDERNAHPHAYGKFAIVHNGIIENFAALKRECLERGEEFKSETDSEVIVHLIERYYRGDFLSAVRDATRRLVGSYAIAVLCREHPETIVCAAESSPLIAGVGKSGCFVASDLSAIASEIQTAYAASDGELIVTDGRSLHFYDGELHPIEKSELSFERNESVAAKRGYRHFMKKEMSEIPLAISKSTLQLSNIGDFSSIYKVLCQTEYVQTVACGTAYHSTLCFKAAFEALCRVPVEACIASEFRYKNPIVKENTLAIAVSQSGETADTLAAARLLKERGAFLVAVTNVKYSSLTRIADAVIETGAGTEVAVAATKSFNAQLAALYSLVAARAGKADMLKGLDALAKRTLSVSERVRGWTSYFDRVKSVYYIGRGFDRAAALEGSLKLKEISYLPSEGYAAGELKHGTLALVDESTPVVAVITQRELAEKTMNAVHEVAARGARVFLVTSLPEYTSDKKITASLVIPVCEEAFSPILSVIPLQSLAYYVSLAHGNDPDKPRNLAKSVTVE